jgi:hypothetical protein
LLMRMFLTIVRSTALPFLRKLDCRAAVGCEGWSSLPERKLLEWVLMMESGDADR